MMGPAPGPEKRADVPMKDRGLLRLYIDTVKSYAVFSGRSPRAQYWGFLFFYFMFLGFWMLASLVVGVFFFPEREDFLPLSYDFYALLFLSPMMGLIVRRFHDVGMRGWFVIIYPAYWITSALAKQAEDILSPVHGIKSLLKLACLVVFIILGFVASQEGTNRYGPDPYGIEKDDPV